MSTANMLKGARRGNSLGVVVGLLALALAPGLRAANAITWNTLTTPAEGIGGTGMVVHALVTNPGDSLTDWGENHYLALRNAAGEVVYLHSLDYTSAGDQREVYFTYILPDVGGNQIYTLTALEHNAAYFGEAKRIEIPVTTREAYGGMTLSATAFDRYAPANIATTNARVFGFPGYRLRAKISSEQPGWPGWGWHAANEWNRNNYPLDNPPPVGAYATTDLYWVRYTQLHGEVEEVSPMRRIAMTVQGDVTLSHTWFHASSPAKISTSEGLGGAAALRLFATFRDGRGNSWEAPGGYDNNAVLGNLPPAGTFLVDLYWRKYDANNTVIGSSAVRTVTVNVTSGPMPLLPATPGSVSSYNTNQNDSSGDEVWAYDTWTTHPVLAVTQPGILRVRATSTTADALSEELLLNLYRDNGAAGAHVLYAPGELEVPVAAGETYRVDVTSQRNLSIWEEQIFGFTLAVDLLPYAPAPTITSGAEAVGGVGVEFAGYAVTTSTAGAVTFTVPAAGSVNALPPGLMLNPTTGAITGTPTTAGSYNVLLTASNSGGQTSKEVSFAIKPVPVLVYPEQVFTNPQFGYVTLTANQVSKAEISGLPGLPPPTGQIRYVVTQAGGGYAANSSPVGRFLGISNSPLPITAIYDGDGTYAGVSATAPFRVAFTYEPTAPSEVRVGLLGPDSFSLNWLSSGGVPAGAGVALQFDISLDGGLSVAATVTTGKLSAVFNGRTASTTYSVAVRGRDQYGNQSGWSSPITVTTLAPGAAPSYVARWFDVNGDGLDDEIIESNSPVFTHSPGDADDIEITYTEWAQTWAYVEGYTIFGNRYQDGVGRSYYIPGQWVPQWTEEIATVSVPRVRPIFQFQAQTGSDYVIGRVAKRTVGGQTVDALIPIFSIPSDETSAGITTWEAESAWAEARYYSIPFVLARISKPMNGVRIALPAAGPVDVGVLSGGGTISAPGVGNITIGNGTATGSVTVGGVTVGATTSGGPVSGRMSVPGVGTVKVGSGGVTYTPEGGQAAPVTSENNVLPNDKGVVATQPDGSIFVRQGDGTEITVKPDGEATVVKPDGTRIHTTPAGKTTVTAPNGSSTARDSAGNIEITTLPGATSVPVSATDPDGTVQGGSHGRILVDEQGNPITLPDGSVPGSVDARPTTADGVRKFGVRQTPTGPIVWVTVIVPPPPPPQFLPRIGQEQRGWWRPTANEMPWTSVAKGTQNQVIRFRTTTQTPASIGFEVVGMNGTSRDVISNIDASGRLLTAPGGAIFALGGSDTDVPIYAAAGPSPVPQEVMIVARKKNSDGTLGAELARLGVCVLQKRVLKVLLFQVVDPNSTAADVESNKMPSIGDLIANLNEIYFQAAVEFSPGVYTPAGAVASMPGYDLNGNGILDFTLNSLGAEADDSEWKKLKERLIGFVGGNYAAPRADGCFFIFIINRSGYYTTIQQNGRSGGGMYQPRGGNINDGSGYYGPLVEASRFSGRDEVAAAVGHELGHLLNVPYGEIYPNNPESSNPSLLGGSASALQPPLGDSLPHTTGGHDNFSFLNPNGNNASDRFWSLMRSGVFMSDVIKLDTNSRSLRKEFWEEANGRARLRRPQ